MSKTKTRAEIAAEWKAAEEQFEAQRAEAVATIADLNQQIEDAKTELVKSDEVKAEFTAKVDELTEKITALNAENDRLTEECTEAKSDLQTALDCSEKLRAALANPAHVDAAMIPDLQNVEVVDAEADAQEAKAEKEEQEKLIMTQENFHKLSPMEQNAFFRKGGRVKVD